MKKRILFLAAMILLSVAFTACSFSKKECEHSYSDMVVAATCTEDGYTEHTCAKCGEVITDTIVSKYGHKYISEVIAPSCTAEGYTVHTCSACGDKYTDSTVAKLAHTYNVEVIAPDCMAEGYDKHTCTACGDTFNDNFTAKTKHRFNAAPCSNCGMAEITENIVPNTEWYSTDKIQFSITTAEELAGLATLVNDGASFNNQTVYLEADIDLGYYEWIPIGNAESPFNGIFNGNGHTVSGLKINATYSYVGLFGNVSGSILDFKVDDASIYVKDVYENVAVACGYLTGTATKISASGFVDSSKAKFVGGIVGRATLSSALLTNLSSAVSVVGSECTGGIIGRIDVGSTLQTDMLSNTGDVTGTQQVGGIFGYVKANVGSAVYGATVCANILGEYYVGGIVGKADNVAVSHCNNDGSSVTATSYYSDGTNFFVWLGGYVGSGYSVNNCVNNVEINYNSRGAYVGGIAGYLTNTVTNCENNGNITAYSYIGGIVGTINTTAALTVSSLKNSGNISGGYRIGGIIGSYESTAATTLTNLENSGTITSTSSRVSGIIGYHNNGTATVTAANLKNSGDVTGQNGEAGGLFGRIEGSTSSIIKNSTSSASIVGAYRIGGLVGVTSSVAIIDCSNDGSVVTATGWHTEGATDYVWLGGYVGQGYIITGCTNNSDIIYDFTGIYVGGIVGHAKGYIQNCTNNGNVVTKTSYVGGIAGEINSPAALTFKNLTNTGDISGASYVGGILGVLYSVNDTCASEQYQKTKIDYNEYRHEYRYTTTLTDLKNTGKITASNVRVGGIIGYTCLNSSYNTWPNYCCTSYSYYYCNKISNFRIVATNLSNTGEVAASGEVGELFGLFSADLTSPLTTYTVTGSVTVNGEIKEGTYDVGSNTNLTFSGREVYAPDDGENTETPEE